MNSAMTFFWGSESGSAHPHHELGGRHAVTFRGLSGQLDVLRVGEPVALEEWDGDPQLGLVLGHDGPHRPDGPNHDGLRRGVPDLGELGGHVGVEGPNDSLATRVIPNSGASFSSQPSPSLPKESELVKSATLVRPLVFR